MDIFAYIRNGTDAAGPEGGKFSDLKRNILLAVVATLLVAAIAIVVVVVVAS